MGNQKQPYKKLIQSYKQDSISEEERKILMAAVACGKADIALHEEIEQAWYDPSERMPAAKGSEGPLPFEQSKVYLHLTSAMHPGATERNVSARNRLWGVHGNWLAAASLVSIFLIAAWVVRSLHNGSDMSESIPKDFISVLNERKTPEEVSLPDGSLVRLQPAARVFFPLSFDENIREVYLQGDAYFEVTHSAGSRFVVHGYDISAEVLGTSFWVRQDDKAGDSQVEVRTGKVKVMTNRTEDRTLRDAKSVLVLPNHKVSYLRKGGKLHWLLADSLLPTEQRLEEQEKETGSHYLKFERPTPLGDILAELTRLYGIEIWVSTPGLKHCLVTGDLSRQDLFGKLDLICLSIGATYEQKDSAIFIRGQGCSQ